MSPDGAARGLGIGALALGMLAAAASVPFPRLLVWNASPSIRKGFYLVEPWVWPRTGDLALAFAPHPSRALASKRGYVPSTVPLLKRVAASDGDRVCGLGAIIAVNGRRAVTRARTDPSGRAMPWWSGCETLGRGSVLLLAPAEDSFDGRYFGATRGSDMLGRGVFIWSPDRLRPEARTAASR